MGNWRQVWLLRSSYFFYSRGIARLGGYLAFLVSLFRGNVHVLNVWPSESVVLGPDVAIFIHFEPLGTLAERTIRYVRSLHDNGFDIVFVSNSGALSPGVVTVLKPFCKAVVVRRNIGYDFGAIRETLNLFALPRPETARLLIANDSVYGPLVPLRPILDGVDFNKADVWGATESWQNRYHLQSYFLIVGRQAMTSSAWKGFWQSVRQVSSKEWVIHRYEVGLTQALVRAGIRCRAIWRYDDLIRQVANETIIQPADGLAADPINEMRVLAATRRHSAIARHAPMNPTAELWRHLLRAGYPFLKIELLRENPAGVLDVLDWREVISSLPDADIAVIERDLQAKMRNRVP